MYTHIYMYHACVRTPAHGIPRGVLLLMRARVEPVDRWISGWPATKLTTVSCCTVLRRTLCKYHSQSGNGSSRMYAQ